MKENSFMCFIVCKGLWNDDVAGARGTPYLGRYGRERAGFKNGGFVKEKLGGVPKNDSEVAFFGRNVSQHVPDVLIGRAPQV